MIRFLKQQKNEKIRNYHFISSNSNNHNDYNINPRTIQIMKKLIFLLLVSTAMQAQSIKAFTGYKSAEINYTIKGDLNFGIAASVTDSKEIANRATKTDPKPFAVHTANTKVSPSLFLLIGATIEDFNITGKLGVTYFDQSINEKKEAQNIYRSVGAQVQYKRFAFSFDSTNSAMIGYEFNL